MDKKKKGLSGGLKALLIIIIIVCAGVLGFSAYKIIGIKKSYSDAENYYNNIEKIVSADKNSDEEETKGGNVPTEDNAEKTIGGVPVDQITPYAGSVVAAPTQNTEAASDIINVLKNPDSAKADDGSENNYETQPVEETTPAEHYDGSENNYETQPVEETTPAEHYDGSENNYETRPDETTTQAVPENNTRATGYVYSLTDLMKGRRKVSDILTKHASINWNFDSFYEICEDAQGYIYQKETKISYPVVQAEDNDKYLRHLTDGTYNVSGTIFVDYHYEDGLESRYAVVYGHNMDDKSMFGSITSYKDKEYYEEHPYFEIYTDEGQYAYYVYAAGQVAVDSDVFTVGMSDEEFLEQMEMIKEELRDYEMNPPVHITENSHVLVLSTCIDYPRDYNYRYVVVIVRGEPLLDKLKTNKK